MIRTYADHNYCYNGRNWAFQVKTIFDQHGFSDIWLNQCDIKIPVNITKQRIWFAEINNSNFDLKVTLRTLVKLNIEMHSRDFNRVSAHGSLY